MSKNSVATGIKVSAISLSAFGVIGSFILGKVYEIVDTSGFFEKTRYNWSVAITGILCCAITGLLLYGFGEVISLLQKSVDIQEKISSQLRENSATPTGHN